MEGFLDFHTHILFDVDHGVQDLKTMNEVLDEYRKNGFETVVMTPHIYEPKVRTKTENIRKNFKIAEASALERGIKAYLGSETFVFAQATIKTISIDGRFTLIEFPIANRPLYLEQRLKQVIVSGLIPVIAHVERYKWLNYNSEDVTVLRKLGCLFQANVAGIENEAVNDYLKNGLIDIIASDNHGDVSLPSRLAKCLKDHPVVLNRMQNLGL